MLLGGRELCALFDLRSVEVRDHLTVAAVGQQAESRARGGVLHPPHAAVGKHELTDPGVITAELVVCSHGWGDGQGLGRSRPALICLLLAATEDHAVLNRIIALAELDVLSPIIRVLLVPSMTSANRTATAMWLEFTI